MQRLWRILLGTVALVLLSLAGVWVAGRLSPAYTLDLGPQEWGRIQNSNEWEETADGAFTYRWTKDVTRFRLPALGTPRRLTLRLTGRPEGMEPAEVTLALDGHDVVRFVPPGAPHLYHIAYDGPTSTRWETVVELRTIPFSPPGDPRELGVAVDRLHFSPPLGAIAPNWALVGLLAAVGLAAILLAEALGWPPYTGGVVAVLPVLGLSALLTWARPAALPWAGLTLATLLAAVGVAVLWAERRKTAEAQPQAANGERAILPFPEERATSDGRPDALALALVMLAVLLALLPLLGRYLPGGDPDGGFWALHMRDPFYPQIGPIPRRLQPWLPLVAVAFAAVPALNCELRHLGRWLWETGETLTGRVRPAGRRLLLGLLFVPLGYLLRARILWGDGAHLIARIGAGYRFAEPEMLPFFLQSMLYQWTSTWWGWSVPDTYTLTSLVLGALYIALAAALGHTLGRNRFEKAFVFGLLGTLAIVQFGFGYLENYGYVTIAFLALFWQMVRCLRGEGSSAMLVALWVLSGTCHLQALLLGPAVLYVFIWTLRQTPAGGARRRQGLLAAAAGLVSAAALMGLFLAGGYNIGDLLRGAWSRGNNPYLFVPLQAEAPYYTLFSLRHLANVLNEHLFVAPVVLPLLVLVAAWHPRRVPWREPVFIALALSAAGLLLFASTLYPDLGAPMDWDLLGVSALPYTLLAGLAYNRAVPEGRGKRYAATVLLVAAGVHAGMWVLQNARWL